MMMLGIIFPMLLWRLLNKMKFLSSAVKIFPTNNEPKIYTGLRHVDCWQQIKNVSPNWPSMLMINGFLVEDNNTVSFVDRYKGAKIAKELGYTLEYDHVLYSEDIWPETE